MLQHRQLAALQVLFQLARADQPATARRMASALGVSAVEACRLLLELERLGLADAGRVRLTLVGLTMAVARPAVPRLRSRVQWPKSVAA